MAEKKKQSSCTNYCTNSEQIYSSNHCQEENVWISHNNTDKNGWDKYLENKPPAEWRYNHNYASHVETKKRRSNNEEQKTNNEEGRRNQ